MRPEEAARCAEWRISCSIGRQLPATHNFRIQSRATAKMKIEELLARRSDLSTFLVHLTRDHDALTARQRLESILMTGTLMRGSPMGHALSALTQSGMSTDSQRCVCFTETPLEHVCLLTGLIEGRSCQFAPYGIGITKKQARTSRVNPVWYVDITPGHAWLSQSINAIIDPCVADGTYDSHPISQLAPFMEQMGTGKGYRKEFWWEREWRMTGDMLLPGNFIAFCPEGEIAALRALFQKHDRVRRAHFVDPSWSLEQIIAHLAGFSAGEVGPL